MGRNSFQSKNNETSFINKKKPQIVNLWLFAMCKIEFELKLFV